MTKANENKTLQWLLGGLDATIFFEQYFEKKAYHVKDRKVDFYAKVLSIEEIEEVLQLGKLPTNALRMVNNGQILSDEKWRKGKGRNIDPNKIFAEIQRGSSLVLEQFDQYQPKLHQFVAHLKAELKAHIWANIYITPATSKAFKRHYDNHDVFVLQLSGTKDWKLYDIVADLPDVDLQQATVNYSELEVVQELRLQAGDLLYVPRGMVHEAITTDVTSVHITLGMKMPRMKDVLKHVQAKAVEQLFFRKNIVNALEESGNMSALEQQFRASIADMLAQQPFEEWLRQAKSDFYHNYFKKLPVAGLSNLILSDNISEETAFLLRPDGVYTTYQEGMFFCVEWNGRKKQFPLPLQETIAHVFSGESVRIKALKGNAPMKYKLKLVKELLAEHWLNIVQ